MEFDQMPKELQLEVKRGTTKHRIRNYKPNENGNIYTLHRVGKHVSGALLDGKEYKEPTNYHNLIK